MKLISLHIPGATAAARCASCGAKHSVVVYGGVYGLSWRKCNPNMDSCIKTTAELFSFAVACPTRALLVASAVAGRQTELLAGQMSFH